jgi:hypothetical protein
MMVLMEMEAEARRENSVNDVLRELQNNLQVFILGSLFMDQDGNALRELMGMARYDAEIARLCFSNFGSSFQLPFGGGTWSIRRDWEGGRLLFNTRWSLRESSCNSLAHAITYTYY